MSYHFYIQKKQPVSYQSILQKLGRNDVHIAYAEEYNLEETITQSARFYIPDRSSRGISVSEDEGTFDVGINILSSGEDYLLACELALSIATLTESEVEPESGEGPMNVTDFAEQYNTAWAESNKTMGVNAINYMVKEKGDTVNFSGCLRSYFFGPELLEQFTKDNPSEEGLYDRIIHSVKAVQYLPETIRIPGVYVVTPQEGDKWEYIVLLPEQEQLMLKTDYVIFYIDENNRHKVPYDAVELYAKQRFKRLDEKQYIFPALSTEEYLKMLETVVPKEEKGETPKKKWWKCNKH